MRKVQDVPLKTDVPCKWPVFIGTLYLDKSGLESMKFVWLIKICLHKAYNAVQVDKYLSDTFPTKKGDAVSLFLFRCTLEYATGKIHAHQEGLKLCGTHQLLVCADDINLLGGNICTIKKNPGASLVPSKESGCEVNAETDGNSSNKLEFAHEEMLATVHF